MLRHQQQHATSKPFNCTFCSKAFKRSDVLRAHQFRCKERGDAPVPEGQSKGRKRSSCASCVKLRTRCDQETPCSRCQELGKECVRAPTTHPYPVNKRSDASRPKSRDAISIAHLLNNAGDDEFHNRFPVPGQLQQGDEDEATAPSPENESETSHWSEEIESYDPWLGAPDSGFDSFFDGLESLTFGNSSMSTDPLAMQPINMCIPDARAQALEPRAHEIRQALQTTAMTFGGTLPEMQPLLELGPAISQLTASEVASLIDLFFQHYHKHCPIIHKASFQPTNKPLALVLAVVALGGMYAPDKARTDRMRSLLDVIELYIFNVPGIREEFAFSFDLSQAADEETQYANFEMLQGAYLIVVAQYFSGNLAAKRRARRQRFMRVLDIARSLKLPSAQHSPYISISDQAAFTAWQREESRIRHFAIMTALDAAMAIFNNVPPRITFSELDLHLPSDQVFWNMGSYTDLINQAIFPRPRMKMLDAFQLLFAPTPEFQVAAEKETWNCWDCMYLIHLLYSHVWRQTFSNPLLRKSPFTTAAPANILDPLKTAMRNWKSLWDDVRSQLTTEQIAGMGFEISSDSYWTLTKLIIQAFDTGNPKEDPVSLSGSASVASGGAHDQGGTAAQQTPRGPSTYPDPASVQAIPTSQTAHVNGHYPDRSQYAVGPGHGMAPLQNGMNYMHGMNGMNGIHNINNMQMSMGMNGMNLGPVPVDQRMAVPSVKQEEEAVQSSGYAGGLNLGGNYPASSEPASATATDFATSRGGAPDFMPLEADCDIHGAHLKKVLGRAK